MQSVWLFWCQSTRARVAVPLKAAHEWRHCEYVASVSYRVPSFVGDRWIYDVVNWSNAFETRGGPGSTRWWKSTFVGVEEKRSWLSVEAWRFMVEVAEICQSAA